MIVFVILFDVHTPSSKFRGVSHTPSPGNTPNQTSEGICVKMLGPSGAEELSARGRNRCGDRSLAGHLGRHLRQGGGVRHKCDATGREDDGTRHHSEATDNDGDGARNHCKAAGCYDEGTGDVCGATGCGEGGTGHQGDANDRDGEVS